MYWGIDSGSTSVNVLLLNDEKDIGSTPVLVDRSI